MMFLLNVQNQKIILKSQYGQLGPDMFLIVSQNGGGDTASTTGNKRDAVSTS